MKLNPKVFIDERSRRPIQVNRDATLCMTTKEARQLIAQLMKGVEYAEAGPEVRKECPESYVTGWVSKVCK